MQNFRDLAAAWENRREKVAPITTATRDRKSSLIRDIGSLPLDAPLDDYLSWIARLQERGSAPSTIAGQITTALAIARQARIFLRDQIAPDRVPVETLEQVRDYARIVKASGPSRARHRSATAKELHCLIRAAQERRGTIRLELIIPFAVATALRRSELMRITWADYDHATSTLMVRKRKNPRQPVDQRIPLSPAAVAILRELGPGHPQARIFPHSAMAVTNAFRALCDKAGLENLKFKDFRSTAAQHLFDRGWSADQVAGVTGHRNLAILLAHYASAKPESLAVRLASEERKLH